jgi:hypothetical protein
MEIIYVIYRINTGNVNATQKNKETIERKATCRLHRMSPKDPVMKESCHCQRQGSDRCHQDEKIYYALVTFCEDFFFMSLQVS